jgi:hypothetical protein
MFGFGTGVVPAFAVAAAAPGAAFAPPRAILPPDDADRLAEAGVAASGETVAVALRTRGGHRRVRATIVAPGGSRTPLRTISFNAHSARQPRLAVAPSGEAVAAWLQYDGARWRVAAAVRPAGAARFDRPVTLSEPLARTTFAAVAIGAGGDALVSWQTRATLYAALRPATRAFGTPQALAARPVSWDAELAPDGTAAMAIVGEARGRAVLSLAARAPGAARLGAPAELDRGELNSHTIEVLDAAAADGGHVGVAWGNTDFTRPRLRFALGVYEGVAGGTPVATLQTGMAERALAGPRLALGAHGRAVLAWGAPAPKRPGDPTARERLAVIQRPAGGRFFLVSETVGEELQSIHVAAVALLPDGALITWDGFDTEVFGREGHQALAARL